MKPREQYAQKIRYCVLDTNPPAPKTEGYSNGKEAWLETK